MIAVDTQILVYAHRRDSAWHEPAFRRIAELAASPVPWAIPMHCLVELYATVTRPGIYRPASTPAEATEQIEVWLSAPRVRVLEENARTWSVLRDLLSAARVVGPSAYDARIAAVCLQHGVTELWTADRDYLAYPTLRVRNPLVDIPPSRASEPRAAYQAGRGPVTVTPPRRRRTSGARTKVVK